MIGLFDLSLPADIIVQGVDKTEWCKLIAREDGEIDGRSWEDFCIARLLEMCESVFLLW